MSTYEIEQQFIRQFQRNREPLSQKQGYGNLEDKYLRILKKIYEGKDSQFLKGKEAE